MRHLRYRPETTKAVLMCEQEGKPTIHWFYEKMQQTTGAVADLVFQCYHCSKRRIWGNEQNCYASPKKEVDTSGEVS